MQTPSESIKKVYPHTSSLPSVFRRRSRTDLIIEKNRKKGKSRKESWNGSDEMLEHFWKEDTSTITSVENPYYDYWWKYGNILSSASSEAARRYYSVKELLAAGALTSLNRHF